MTETSIRRTFFVGTFIAGVALGALSVDSLRQVVTARTPPLSADVIAGKHVWQERNCNDCHTILGIGGYYAPDLTRVVERRDEPWLRKFLKNPAAAKPGTTMPDEQLTDAQVNALVAFHRWVNGINTNNWPPAPLVGGGGGGALLFDQKGCSTCHSYQGRGADGPGPNLTPIAQRADARVHVIGWLADPEQQNPETIMPRPELTLAERAALVAYIAEGR
jgi:nitric oxide reductase subunit C